MTTEQGPDKPKQAWSISNKEGKENKNYLKMEGRALCKLVGIEQRMVKKWEEPDVLEPKLMFVFVGVDKKLAENIAENESYSATMWVRPSMFRATGKGRTSKMVETLDAMSESGKVPEPAMANPETFQAYAETMIGLSFQCTIEHKNGYNTVKSITYCSPEEAARLGSKILIARSDSYEPKEGKKVDLGSYPTLNKLVNGDAKAQTSLTLYTYDLTPLIGEPEKIDRALGLITKAGGSQDSLGLWNSPTAIPALNRLKLPDPPKETPLEEDDIPF